MTDAPSSETDVSRAEKARRRRVLWVTLLLLFGLPVYIFVAGSLVAALNAPATGPNGELIPRPLHWAIELLVYLGLGIVWALPLKRLVQGVGKAKS